MDNIKEVQLKPPPDSIKEVNMPKNQDPDDDKNQNQNPADYKCGECGATFRNKVNFCPECGTEFES